MLPAIGALLAIFILFLIIYVIFSIVIHSKVDESSLSKKEQINKEDALTKKVLNALILLAIGLWCIVGLIVRYVVKGITLTPLMKKLGPAFIVVGLSLIIASCVIFNKVRLELKEM